MKKSPVKLSMKETVELNDYIRQAHEDWAERQITYKEARKEAETGLQFSISESGFREMIRIAGVEWQATWSRARLGTSVDEAVMLVKTELENIKADNEDLRELVTNLQQRIVNLESVGNSKGQRLNGATTHQRSKS